MLLNNIQTKVHGKISRKYQKLNFFPLSKKSNAKFELNKTRKVKVGERNFSIFPATTNEFNQAGVFRLYS